MNLTLNGQLRTESRPEVIANLLRKGWVDSPKPSFDTRTQQCNWNGSTWVVSAIPPVVKEELPKWALHAFRIIGRKAGFTLAELAVILEEAKNQ